METADYWLMAWEYSIWNAAMLHYSFGQGTSTQSPLAQPQNMFIPHSSTPLLVKHYCQQSDETLFGCFIIALNAAYIQPLSLADEGYESGSDTIDLPTPLWKTPCIHHVSSMEHTSFNPVTTTHCSTVTITPHSTTQTPPRPVCRCLSFSSDNDQAPDSTPICSDSSDEEEDFQSVPLFRYPPIARPTLTSY